MMRLTFSFSVELSMSARIGMIMWLASERKKRTKKTAIRKIQKIYCTASFACGHLLGLYAQSDLLVEGEQPEAESDLVLHLVLARRRLESAVEEGDERVDAVQLVEDEAIVVDAKEHYEATTQRLLVRVLLCVMLRQRHSTI